MQRLPKSVRQAVALAVGIPVLILGVALLVLPGPGLLFIVLGLLILAREFEWAQRHADRAKASLKKVTDRAKQTSKDRSSKDND